MAAIPTQEEQTTESIAPFEENDSDDIFDAEITADISVDEITAGSILDTDAMEHLDSTTATWENIEFYLERKYGSKKTIKLDPTEEDTTLLIDFISRAEFEEDETAAQVWLAKFVKLNDSHPTLTMKS